MKVAPDGVRDAGEKSLGGIARLIDRVVEQEESRDGGPILLQRENHLSWHLTA